MTCLFIIKTHLQTGSNLWANLVVLGRNALAVYTNGKDSVGVVEEKYVVFGEKFIVDSEVEGVEMVE